MGAVMGSVKRSLHSCRGSFSGRSDGERPLSQKIQVSQLKSDLWLAYPDGKWSPRFLPGYAFFEDNEAEKSDLGVLALEVVMESEVGMTAFDLEQSEAPVSGLDHISFCKRCIVAQPLVNQSDTNERANLVTLARWKLPLLAEVAGYLNAAHDLLCLCQSTREVSPLSTGYAWQLDHWECLYKQRWPAFHCCFQNVYKDPQDWPALFRDTLVGIRECTLEVFEREKKLGFTMSAMVAQVRYEVQTNTYIANYLSASKVLPERIPAEEERRLRFCPVAVPSACHSYPYGVLEGVEDQLQVGHGVELQWKMQLGSPFGWWYGTLEALDPSPDGTTASATVVFSHFPTNSRWYRLSFVFGDGIIRRCGIGGYHGGLRAVNEAEQQRWMHFFPKDLVSF